MLTDKARVELEQQVEDWRNCVLQELDEPAPAWRSLGISLLNAVRQCLISWGVGPGPHEDEQEWLESQLRLLLPLPDDNANARRVKRSVRDSNLQVLVAHQAEGWMDFLDGRRNGQGKPAFSEIRERHLRSLLESRYRLQFTDQWTVFLASALAAVRYAWLQQSGTIVEADRAARDETVQFCLRDALLACHRLWNLCPDQIGPPGSAGDPSLPAGFDPLHPASSVTLLSALDHESRETGGAENLMATCGLSAWLSLWSLLEFYLGEDPPRLDDNSVAAVNRLPLGLVIGEGDAATGVRGLLAVSLEQRHAPACYMDPARLGMMLIDREMLRSIRAAWKLVRQTLQVEDGALRDRSVSLRLAPQVEELSVLDGDSAGTAFLVGMYLTARGKEYDSSTLISLAMRLNPQAWQRASLTANDFHFGPVAGIYPKVRGWLDPVGHEANPDPELQVSRFIVHPDTDHHRNATEAESAIKDSTGTGTIDSYDLPRQWDDLIRSVTGNHRRRKALEAWCVHQVSAWDNSKATDPACLERYQPSGLLYRQRPKNSDDPDGLAEARQRAEDTRDASDLLSRMELQPLTTLFASEDERFQRLFEPADDSEPSRRILVIAGPGEGKTIFTRRLVTWLSRPQTWQKLSFLNGRPCLAVRWENGSASGPWPERGGTGSATSFEAYRKSLVRQLAASRAIQKQCQEQHVTPEEIIDEALDSGRVVIVLDAFDQLSGEEGERQKATLREVCAYFREEYPQVRLVVTSRPLAAAEHRGPDSLFPVREWRLLHIQPFSPWQQVEYLKDLLEKYLGIADEFRAEWDAMFDEVEQLRQSKEFPTIGSGPAASDAGEQGQTLSDQETRVNDWARRVLRQVFDDYDAVAELLQYPVVLRFVRFLAEQTGRFPRFTTRGDLYFQVTDHVLDRNLEKKSTELSTLSINRETARDYVREIIAATAFELFSRHAPAHHVQGDGVFRRLRDGVKKRITTPGIVRHFDQLWPLAQDVAAMRSFFITEQPSQNLYGFSDRRMCEFYTGLHLCRNSEQDWAMSPDNENPWWRCGEKKLADLGAEPEWEQAWRFAMELPLSSDSSAQQFAHDAIWPTSMNSLFDRPGERPRPCGLMYDIWPFYLMATGFMNSLQHPQTAEGMDIIHDAQVAAVAWTRKLVDDVCLDLKESGQWKSRIVVQPATGQGRRSRRRRKTGPGQNAALEAAWREIGRELVQEDRFRSLDDPDEQWRAILLQGLVRFLGEHRLMRHGAAGHEKRSVMAWFERGFRRVPSYNDEELANQPELLNFWMGDDSRLSYDDEPVHVNRVSGPFAMHQFPMTNSIYCGLFDAHHRGIEDDYEQFSSDTLCPVIYTDHAAAWIGALWCGSSLATETQWEYACRAQCWKGEDQTPRYVWPFDDMAFTSRKVGFRFDVAFTSGKVGLSHIEKGTTVDELKDRLEQHAWTADNTASTSQPVGHERHFNAWGVCDQIGNVWERTRSGWCRDPQQPAAGFVSSFVCRGGSAWYGGLRDYRPSCRLGYGSTDRRNGIGFRCVRVVECVRAELSSPTSDTLSSEL